MRASDGDEDILCKLWRNRFRPLSFTGSSNRKASPRAPSEVGRSIVPLGSSVMS